MTADELVSPISGADSIWLCPQHGVVGTTHDPSCPETIRRYVAVKLVAGLTRTQTGAGRKEVT